MTGLDVRKIAVEVRDRITGWPETHNQGRWLAQREEPIIVRDPARAEAMLGQPAAVWAECGTVACLAGHITAVVAADYPEHLRYHINLFPGSITPFPGSSPSRVDIWSTAESVMGMKADEAAPMFSMNVSREEVLSWLELVAAGEEPTRAVKKALTDRRKRHEP